MTRLYRPRRPCCVKVTMSDEERAEVEALAAHYRTSVASAIRIALAAEAARVAKSLRAA